MLQPVVDPKAAASIAANSARLMLGSLASSVKVT
jgi:hypothetical protein